jgi:DNA-binding NarL/FixJ family response regulator
MSASPAPAQEPVSRAIRVVVAHRNGLRGRRLVTGLTSLIGRPVEEVSALEDLQVDKGEPLVAVAVLPSVDDGRSLSAPSPHVRVLALVVDVHAARRALAAGADSAIVDDGRPEALAAAIEAVAVGHTVVPGALRRRLGRTPLTMREKQILALVVIGLANREIAAKLHVAETTVKSHLSSAFRKLGVRSRNEAAALILDAETGLGAGILTI